VPAREPDLSIGTYSMILLRPSDSYLYPMPSALETYTFQPYWELYASYLLLLTLIKPLLGWRLPETPHILILFRRTLFLARCGQAPTDLLTLKSYFDGTSLGKPDLELLWEPPWY